MVYPLPCPMSHLEFSGLFIRAFIFVTFITPYAVHYKKIRNHLCETATNSEKIHSLAQKSKHLRLNQIQ